MHPIFIDSERLKCSTYPVSSVAHIGDYFLETKTLLRLESGSHYRASELIPCIFGVFDKK